MADFSALKTAIQTYIKQNGNEEITGEILQEILLSVVTTLGDTAINNLVTALADEVAARQNADVTLQQNITNEATARGNADTALSNRLGSSITAENTAAEQIGAEAEARASADTALQGLINGVKNNVDNGYVYAGIATPSSTPATGKVFYLALTAGTYTNFGSTEVSQGINILKYNGSAWSLDAFICIDDVPTANSKNLVESGGVKNSIYKVNGGILLDKYTNTGGNNLNYTIEDLSSLRPLILQVETENTNISDVTVIYTNAESTQISFETITLNEEIQLTVPNEAVGAIIYHANTGGDTNGVYTIYLRTLTFDEKLKNEANELNEKIERGNSCVPKLFLDDSTFSSILPAIVDIFALKDFSSDNKEYWLYICGYRNSNPNTSYITVRDENNVVVEQIEFSASNADVIDIDCAGFKFIIDTSLLPFNERSIFITYNLHINKKVKRFVGVVKTELEDEIKALDEKAVDKASIFYPTVNLCDGKFLANKWILSTIGTPTDRNGWATVQNLIPVELGKSYRFAFFNGTIRRDVSGYFCEYDENKDPIIRSENLISNKYNVEDANVKYIRTSFQIASGETIESSKYMVYEWNARTRWMTTGNASEFRQWQVPYTDFGYEQILPLTYANKGKKMVSFGDSITDFGFYPEYAAYLNQIDVLNVGFGGSRMTNTDADEHGMGSLSMYSLVQAIINNSWTAQEAAAEYYAETAVSENEPKKKWPSKIAKLKQVDFSTIDIVTIALGVNDFSASIPIGTETDNTPSTICGALNSIINLLKTNYPQLHIIVIPPMYRRYGNENQYDSDTYEVGGTILPNVVEAEEKVAKRNHIEYLELYYTLGNNQYCWQTFLADGTHPTDFGYIEIGRRLGGYIASH